MKPRKTKPRAHAQPRQPKRPRPPSAPPQPADSAAPAADSAAGPADNLGARALREVPGSLAELATAIGCARQSIADWRAGAKLPSEGSRARIRAAFGIDETAWDTLADTPRAGRRTRPLAAPVASAAAPRTGGRPDTVGRAIELLEQLRAERMVPGLPATARARFAAAETATLATLARLEERVEMREDRIVREHPMWQRWKATIARVLGRFPDAAKAVADAMAELDS